MAVCGCRRQTSRARRCGIVSGLVSVTNGGISFDEVDFPLFGRRFPRLYALASSASRQRGVSTIIIAAVDSRLGLGTELRSTLNSSCC